MTNKYRVGSMFAGIGGICLGFKRNNCEIVWASEMDKYACETYRYNFDGAEYLVEGNIKDITAQRKNESEEEHIQRVAETIPDIDILNGGFPCQAFSIAGERKGFEDDRGNLFFEIATVLKAKKPKAFLLENVKNLRSHDNGNTFKVIKEELENLGYFVKAEVLNSMDHGNIPQNRERIFIVGFLDKESADKFKFPEKIGLTRTIADLIDLDEKKDEKFYYNKTKYYDDLVREIKRQDTIYQIRRGMYVRENKNNVCPTLTANMGTGGHNVPLIKDNYDIRKLTPEECLLFQGFNVDDKCHTHSFPEFTIDEKGKKRVYANSHKYKQAGNCVTVTVIERIVKNMLEAMESKISDVFLENEIVHEEVALTIDQDISQEALKLDLDTEKEHTEKLLKKEKIENRFIENINDISETIGIKIEVAFSNKVNIKHNTIDNGFEGKFISFEINKNTIDIKTKKEIIADTLENRSSIEISICINDVTIYKTVIQDEDLFNKVDIERFSQRVIYLIHSII